MTTKKLCIIIVLRVHKYVCISDNRVNILKFVLIKSKEGVNYFGIVSEFEDIIPDEEGLLNEFVRFY